MALWQPRTNLQKRASISSQDASPEGSLSLKVRDAGATCPSSWHDSSELGLESRMVTETTEVTTVDTCPRELSRPPPALPPTPYSPHTISNRTISSVATNTSRVSPTLCHILRAGGWARAQRRAAERRDGMDHGCPRAAPPGGGTGRCGGGPRRDRPADLPPAGATESLEERASGRHYRLLIAPGSRSHDERRGRLRTDALPWRTSKWGKSELEVARRTPGPGSSEREVPSSLGDARCQPLPKAAAAAPPLPAPSPAVAHHQAPTPQRLSLCARPAGKCSVEVGESCRSPPNNELLLPGVNAAPASPCSPFLSPVPLVFLSRHLRLRDC